MKTKFKDFLLYSLACVGAISLFISATQPQQTISTVPESHVWTYASHNASVTVIFNKKTGEARKLLSSSPASSPTYEVYKEIVPKEKKKK